MRREPWELQELLGLQDCQVLQVPPERLELLELPVLLALATRVLQVLAVQDQRVQQEEPGQQERLDSRARQVLRVRLELLVLRELKVHQPEDLRAQLESQVTQVLRDQ